MGEEQRIAAAAHLVIEVNTIDRCFGHERGPRVCEAIPSMSC
jgi:hypothetical protein